MLIDLLFPALLYSISLLQKLNFNISAQDGILYCSSTVSGSLDKHAFNRHALL